MGPCLSVHVLDPGTGMKMSWDLREYIDIFEVGR